MKSMTKPCYKLCINKQYWLNERLYKNAKEIIAKLEVKRKCGRPKVDFERALSGIYYVLRTGCQWNALPRCFGSYSAIHRYFQWLTDLRFFEKMWKGEISATLLELALTIAGERSKRFTPIMSPLFA